MNVSVVFSTGDGFVSRAIKWFTKSEASHSMLSFELLGTVYLLHCTMGGVKLTPRRKWFDHGNRLVSEWQFKKDMSANVAWLMAKYLDESYDYPTLFGMGWVRLAARWLKLKAKNPFNSPGALVCSEFILHLGKPEHGPNEVPEWRDLQPDQTDCQMIIDRMERFTPEISSFERVIA